MSIMGRAFAASFTIALLTILGIVFVFYEETFIFYQSVVKPVSSSTRSSSSSSPHENENHHVGTSKSLIETSRQCSLVLNYILSGGYEELVIPADLVTTTSQTAEAAAADTTRIEHHHDDATLLVNASIPTMNHLWETRLHPDLKTTTLNWTKQNLEWNAKHLNYTKMEQDFAKVANELNVPNLRTSLLHPMDGHKMSRLLRIMELRLTDPDNNPPLHIMTFGGSVVIGYNSQFHLWHLNGSVNRMTKGMERNNWPAQMQRIWNEVVFDGKDVVRVTNMASGGATSDVGALALRYGLYPLDHPPPDVIIHAFGNNDMQGNVLSTDEETINDLMEEFIVAAKSVRCDEDGLPVVVLYDDFLGVDKEKSLNFMMTYFRTVSQMSSWHNLMAVSYASAFRHIVYSANGENLYNSSDMPMLAGPFETLHPGIVYHLSAAWTMVYGFVSNMIDSCNDYKTMSTHQKSYSEIPLDRIPPLAEKNTSLTNLQEEWNASVVHRQASCANTTNTTVERPCDSRSWVVHKVGGFDRARQMKRAFTTLHSNVKNWIVEGTSIFAKPRPGWIATAANASFETILDGEHSGIKYVTILSMKSYGKKWEGSQLKVTFWDMGVGGMTNNDEIKASLVGEYLIGGFHHSNTSVLYPHKLLLQGTGSDGRIPVGHWLKTTFTVVGGTTFRIQGILYCSR